MLSVRVASLTSLQTLSIPDYNNYNALVIRIEGDVSNGIFLFIPKIMFTLPINYTLDSTAGALSYHIKAQGHVLNGNVFISYSSLYGWNEFYVHAYGLS